MLPQVTMFGIITIDVALLELLIFIRTSPKSPLRHHHHVNAILTTGSPFGHSLGSPHRFPYFPLQRYPPGIAHYGFRHGIPFCRVRSSGNVHLAPQCRVCGETSEPCGNVSGENSSAREKGDLFLAREISYLDINWVYYWQAELMVQFI
jgi:hypothetical protein